MTNQKTQRPFYELRRYDNKTWVDTVEYAKQVLKEHPDVKIRVGTDSSLIGIKAHYVVVVSFRFPKKGVRSLYRRYIEDLYAYKSANQKPRKKGRYRKRKGKSYNGVKSKSANDKAIKERLLREALLSAELAYHLSQKGVDIEAIDLDYNSAGTPVKIGVDKKGKDIFKMVYHHKSGVAIKEGKAYCGNFKTTLKPELQYATPFADNFFQ